MTTDNAPSRFRKKPVVIEAIQWTGENAEAVQFFLKNGHEHSPRGWVNGRYVDIGTPVGMMVASEGDWIIRGIQGEFYPCKPDIFAATYEPADSQPAMPAELDMEEVEYELRNMASSAYETSMAFGISQDSFERLARDVFTYARRRIEGE